jgi:glycosyltransferase involved in cell wall biosynthesis
VEAPGAPAARRRCPELSGSELRLLIFNEGNLGSHILGQSQIGDALAAGLEAEPSVHARFEALGEMGHLSRFAAYRPLPLLAERGLDPRTLRWHSVQSLRARRSLDALLRADRPDLLYLHTQSIALFARRIMRRLPVVLSVDSSVRDWSQMPAWAATRGSGHQTGPSVALERRSLRGAALVVAWTGWARRGILAEEPRANVIEHHPGLDLERWFPGPHEPRERPRILFVGGRFAEKGGFDLFSALEGRIGTDVDLDLVTPADVPHRDGVTVHRLGHGSPELRRLYQQADLLVLPTYGDTNPWVLLEAMACGTPAVSSDVGAIPEMLDHGRAGTVVPSGDVRGLREAIEALLGDGARREALRKVVRERVERRYDARKQFPALASRMRELV